MGFFEVIVIGLIINLIAKKMQSTKKYVKSDHSANQTLDQTLAQLNQIGKSLNIYNWQNDTVSNDELDSDDSLFELSDEEVEDSQNLAVDAKTIRSFKRKYRKQIQALPPELTLQVESLIDQGPQALKDKVIQLSAYHPSRETLLELVNQFEDLIEQTQESKRKTDLNQASSTVTQDFHDFSDMDYEMEPFIIEGEELAEFSQPLQVERLKSREDSTNHSNQLKEAIVWSEILAPPKAKHK